MKKLFWFVLVFGSVALVTAQERVMDKAEFDAMVNGVYDHKVKWKGEKYRMTVTTSSTMTGRPQSDWASTTMTEYEPSGETRSVYTSTYGGKPAPSKESLRMGSWLYTRSGNDAWTRKEYIPSNTIAKEKEESTRKVLSSQAEYKYLGPSKLSDRPVQVYVKTQRQTVLNEKSGENAETESKNTYWVDGKGILLKSDYTSEYRGKNTMQTRVILEWELDPTITLKTPEIAP